MSLKGAEPSGPWQIRGSFSTASRRSQEARVRWGRWGVRLGTRPYARGVIHLESHQRQRTSFSTQNQEGLEIICYTMLIRADPKINPFTAFRWVFYSGMTPDGQVHRRLRVTNIRDQTEGSAMTYIGRYQPGISRHIASVKLLAGLLLVPSPLATATLSHDGEACGGSGTITFHGSKRSR